MKGPKPPAEAGTVIGGYELVRRIGRGGMAEVWVARKSLGRKGSKFVALKLIADHHAGDERYARMFRSEAELAAVLSHANIVQVFDEGEDDGRSYLVMEWVDGLNLLKLGDMLALLADEQRRFRVISYIIGQLLHALNYAHSITSHDGSPLGVVHRDVSPQNVLVSNHGEVKLTDFGVAYYNIEESSGIHVKGKVRYMSPEQLSGKTRSPTVDLYAVGALLHELLDGKKFRGEFEDGQDLFSVVLQGQVSPMSRSVPPELDRLRIGLLEPVVERRIQSAEQAIAWLKQYPGYGDARDELTKLCGSLTGVLRPRVGPGQSGLVAAAEQATTRWGGRSPLAKPQIDAKAGRPSPPKVPAKPLVIPNRAGPPAAAKSPAEASESSALITGQTEFVLRQSIPGLEGSSAVSTMTPTTPLRASSLRAMMSGPPVPGQSAQPVPGPPPYAGGPPSPPLPSPPPPSPPLPSPAYLPDQPSGPLGGQPHAPMSPVPQYMPGQGSHPIQLQVAPGWPDPNDPYARMPPTQRLATSEASAAAGHSSGTEVLDANMIIEISSGSGTDQEILPVAVAGDGSDTRREVPGAMSTRTNSVSIVLPRRSAVAVIGVGLVMVAVLSVSITWFLFSRDQGDGVSTMEASSLAASAVEAKGASEAAAEAAKAEAVKQEPTQSPVQNLAGGDLPAAEDAAQGLGGQAPPTAAPEEPGSDAAAIPAEEEAPAAAEAVPTPTVEDADTKDEEPNTAEKPKPSDTEPPKPKALPKALVKIYNNTGSAKAEVQIGSEKFKASDKSEHKIPAGKRSIKWRKSPAEDWQSSKPGDFKSGKRFSVFVTPAGASVRNG